MTLEITN